MTTLAGVFLVDGLLGSDKLDTVGHGFAVISIGGVVVLLGRRLFVTAARCGLGYGRYHDEAEYSFAKTVEESQRGNTNLPITGGSGVGFHTGDTSGAGVLGLHLQALMIKCLLFSCRMWGVIYYTRESLMIQGREAQFYY